VQKCGEYGRVGMWNKVVGMGTGLAGWGCFPSPCRSLSSDAMDNKD